MMADNPTFPRKVLLGVTGGIAAYKSAWLVRALVRAGAEVQVVMTEAAFDFVTPLTLSTLSKNPVQSRFVDDVGEGTWNNHVELAEWADLLLIAPLTANTLHKFASGECNDLLTACYLSASCPKYVAPAMDLQMYKDESTAANLQTLSERGVKIIGPEDGELASGLIGKGRMTEPEDILEYLINDFFGNSPWLGKHVLVTAGGTREPIDPVRYIGNRSTGTMGFALAEELAQRGATVKLVVAAVERSTTLAGIDVIEALTAAEMFETCKNLLPEMDVVIKAAAVADFTPKNPRSGKIKKADGLSTIELIKTQDILSWIGENKRDGQVVIGFALESEKGKEEAVRKLHGKHADMIVLNSLSDEGAGFGTNTNQVTLITKDKEGVEIPLMSKGEIAQRILDHAESLL
jgi:phosphopantothenoylcysteine decarboxylase/phosphopantothenate--cysteine ligase